MVVMLFRLAPICAVLLVLAAPGGQGADVPSSEAIRPKARWQHPAGLVTAESIVEIKAKLATEDWARQTYATQKAALAPWLAVPSEKLRQVFPTRRGNVYHNFSCPQDRCRLLFDPFESSRFKCPLCGKTFAPDTEAGIYEPGDRYHATMYDGWACLFYEAAGAMAANMGVAGRVEPAAAGKYFQRGVEIQIGRASCRGRVVISLGVTA